MLFLIWNQEGKWLLAQGNSTTSLAPHLALVGSHLREQSLGHLGSLHLLLNLVIDARRDVDQRLQLQGEVWGGARRLRLGDRIKT